MVVCYPNLIPSSLSSSMKKIDAIVVVEEVLHTPAYPRVGLSEPGGRGLGGLGTSRFWYLQILAGANYAPHITTYLPPEFLDLPTSLQNWRRSGGIPLLNGS